MKYALASLALVAALSTTAAIAQTAGIAVIAQGADGTLYLIGPAGRYTINPTPMSDDALAALPDLGPISGGLPTTQTTAANDKPQTLTGQGALNTMPFSLQGGNYTIDWVAVGGATASCNQIAHLRNVPTATAVNFDSRISNEIAAKGQSIHGQTQAYAVPNGQYYVESDGGCGWSITISPQTP